MLSAPFVSITRSVPKSMEDSSYTISTLKKEAMLAAFEKLVERGDLSLYIKTVENDGSVEIIANVLENLHV